ncbi:MAG: hypothetical protein SVG88_04510 [Halobacteriales archaeon]|nr:hypothetical protein [Halobacteriales archaeon]
MAAIGIAVFLMLLVAVGSGLVLYLLVRAEHDDRKRFSRDDAERQARRDTPDEGEP